MATSRKKQGQSARRRVSSPLSVRRRSSERRKAVGAPIRSDTVSGFTPSPAQIKYLNALEEAVAQRQPHSDTAICAKLGMSWMTVWKWRQCALSCAWLRVRMDQTSDDNWPLILRRHELLAIQGSVRSAEFIAKVKSGLYGQGKTVEPGDGDPARHYTVQLLVHRPDDVASSTVLPLVDPRIQTALMR